MDDSDLEDEFWENIGDLLDIELENKLMDWIEEMKYLISAKYYGEKIKPLFAFY